MESEPRPDQQRLTWTQRRIVDAIDFTLATVGESVDSVTETNPAAIDQAREQYQQVIREVLRELGVLPIEGTDETLSRWLGF